MRIERLDAWSRELDELAVGAHRATFYHTGAWLRALAAAYPRMSLHLLVATDNGRAIISAGVPPINKPSKEEVARQAEQPDWLLTLPSGVHQVFDYWKANLKPGGFKFEARIINYPGGMPGDVGLFFSWPKDSEA
jgi:hypothetical protein